MSFKDHFSGHAAEYAQFRPHYPDALFAYLASLAPSRELAWDCATGNGQAAGALAAHFTRVIATDASRQQIQSAMPHAGVEYRIAPAERSGLDSGTVDLVTVAQALHWFDIPAFFAEARRVLKSDGIIAVWTYTRLTVATDIAAIVQKFYDETTGPYWAPERAIAEAGYRTFDFPFEEIAAPAFSLEAQWTLAQLLGYLRTWSATQKFIEAHGFDPVVSLREEIERYWTEADSPRLISWQLTLRVGRVRD